MDPFSAGMFASIGSALKFADVAVRISEVGSENAVFVRTIYVVRSDLEEVERLLSLDAVQKKLAGTPGKLPWVKTAIFNTRSALNEIGKWVERARVEHETTGSIKFDTRVRWVFNDHEKLLNRKTELSTCHQQLSNVLSYLIHLEDVPVNPAPLEYENVNHFDEIMSRHRRATGPRAPKAEVSTTTSARETVAGSTTAPLVHPTAVLPASSPSSGQVTTAYDQRGSVRSPFISSTLSSPGSPPPTYAAAVSTKPFLHDTRLHAHSSTDQKSPLDQFVNRRLAPQNKNNRIWAYRNDFEGIAIPELPGDAVSFSASATNPAGPVNPYEFYNKLRTEPFGTKVKSYGPCENLAEMLGDLHFSAELPSHDPGPPPGYPPRTRARSDQLGLSPSTYTQSRRRTASETPFVVHRRPVPANSHSDSLFVSSQIPTSFPVQKAISSGIEQVPQPYMTRPVANELVTQGSHQSYLQHRPSSYSNAQSAFWAAGDSSSQSSRHISAPPPLPLASNVNVAAYSAESTGSWGSDTQPRVSKQQPTRGPPAATTRMQRQKHLLSLLGSIDR